MDTIEALMSRVSTGSKRLLEPGPSDNELTLMLEASMTTPDHRGLKPWRFIVVKGEARAALGDVFATAAKRRDPDTKPTEIDRQRDKGANPPITLVVVATLIEDEKVPDYEQLITAGIAAQQVQLAAFSMGYGTILVSGEKVNDAFIKQSLNIADEEIIIGFISMGSVESVLVKSRSSAESLTEYWTPSK